jgi:hypothetical protein
LHNCSTFLFSADCRHFVFFGAGTLDIITVPSLSVDGVAAIVSKRAQARAEAVRTYAPVASQHKIEAL